jgi:hypothetical protein
MLVHYCGTIVSLQSYTKRRVQNVRDFQHLQCFDQLDENIIYTIYSSTRLPINLKQRSARFKHNCFHIICKNDNLNISIISLYKQIKWCIFDNSYWCKFVYSLSSLLFLYLYAYVCLFIYFILIAYINMNNEF